MNKTIYKNAKILQFKNKLNSLKKNNLNLFRSYSTNSLTNRHFSTSAVSNSKFKHLRFITPLKRAALLAKNFYTLDIETVNVKGFQQPIIITFKDRKECKSFVIDSTIVNKDAVNDLWIKFFNYLFTNIRSKNNTIFTHNLGGFDGIFIHKFVSNMFDDVETIIDESGKYILIKVTLDGVSFSFKDSLRLFPVSLNDLCKVFNVPGKLAQYKIEWNNPNTFK